MKRQEDCKVRAVSSYGRTLQRIKTNTTLIYQVQTLYFGVV